jgi:hypothetical protein
MVSTGAAALAVAAVRTVIREVRAKYDADEEKERRTKAGTDVRVVVIPAEFAGAALLTDEDLVGCDARWTARSCQRRQHTFVFT